MISIDYVDFKVYGFGVYMAKKILIILLLVFSVLLFTGAVFGAEVKNSDSSSNSTLSSKSIISVANPIKKISTSKSTIKSGTNVKINVNTAKSVKSVYVYINGKGNFKFKKSSNGNWYYKLKTNKYKTGKYKLNIKAFTSNKKKSYNKYTYLTIDNIPPKINSLKSNVKNIIAGNPFYIEAITDKTSNKVVAKVRGKTISFNSNPINVNNNNYNSHNARNWTLNAKISYKEIGNLAVAVYVYDSAGNVAKKTLYIQSTPRYVYWDGTLLKSTPIKVYYSNPANIYQKSINALSKYVKVYEGYAGNGYTLGITYNNGYKATKVIIAYKDPFVVYHEMGHVLNWRWTEYQCDLYAYKKVGYWIL